MRDPKRWLPDPGQQLERHLRLAGPGRSDKDTLRRRLQLPYRRGLVVPKLDIGRSRGAGIIDHAITHHDHLSEPRGVFLKAATIAAWQGQDPRRTVVLIAADLHRDPVGPSAVTDRPDVVGI